jgi:lipid II:glycine glycyltransferase (peptidoglycan interpeptide bridge formation enzyme)
MDVQPPSTVVLDLSPSEEELLAAMKSKTRYNVRLSLKKGVTVTECGEEQLDAWYRLYRETGIRDRIAVHAEEYFREMFRLSRRYGRGAPEYRLLMARHDGDLLAGIVVAFRGARAWYPFGASAGLKRNLMPTYALQWRAIQLARSRGCESYDLFGIPPAPDPRHPMHGLYQFKTGFGGKVVNRYGCWDAVLKRPRYAAYRAAERARRYYYLDFRKRERLAR